MNPWWRGAVLYQIYPRSFRDANNDGVGDLRGVLKGLDYIASLGVDGIWLSPFYRSPMRDFGYDVSDYCAVDPLFGSLSDFDALLKKAHALNLKVIIDQVYSHTSDEHPWFQESRASRDNPKADWYVWADAKPDGAPPNNWQASFGGASWEWDARRRQYYLHNFLTTQPDLNVRNEAVQNALLDVARFWLDRGVDGFRLDVANFYVQDEYLRDNPARPFTTIPARPAEFQRHLYDRSQPETLAFLSRLRSLMDAYGDRFAVGEIEDEQPLERQLEYTRGEDRLHTAYSFYLLRKNALTPKTILKALSGWDESWPSWSFSNHDVPRAATRLAANDPARIRQAMALLLCLRGTIFLYQGEELGLPQADVPFDRLRDPEAIAFWPHGIGRDGARTPIPWTENGGFNAGAEPWLPYDTTHFEASVTAQEQRPDSLLSFTRRLVAVRNRDAALRVGTFADAGSEGDVLTFARTHGNDRTLCVFNLSGEPQSHVVPSASQRDLALLTGKAHMQGEVLHLPPWSSVLIRG